jgi:hypothetical protein
MKLAAKLATAAASVTLAFSAVGVNSAQAVFVAPYAVSSWVTTNTNDNGSVNTSNAPTDITIITGADNGTATQGSTDYTVTANTFGQPSGLVSFSWIYSTNDVDSSTDPFSFIISGQLTDILNNSEYLVDVPRNFTATVANGDSFGFRLATDNYGGSATVTISNFSVTPVPEPSALPCMVLLVGGLFVLKQKYSQVKNSILN